MNVHDNQAEQRFELEQDGQLAIAAYRVNGGTITFTHTVVPRALEGRGIGSALITAALDSVRERGLNVIPDCSFVRDYIDRHPEYRGLLA